MGEIKKIPTVDIMNMVEIVNNAYPAFPFNTEEEKKKIHEKLMKNQEENDFVNFYGYYEDGEMRGSMRLHDYTMNMLSNEVKVGGIGLVAVDLLHKKKKIAKRMLEFYLDHYKKRGTNLVMLYPFRPDFYKKMGFGFGTKMEQYKLLPKEFPNRGSKDHIVYVTNEDKQRLHTCYEQFVRQHHGMLYKTPFELDSIFNKPENKIIAFKKDGKIEGYVIFTFKRANESNFGINDIHVHEFVYLHSEALGELLTFFHSQADQINRIVINTQDEHFHFLFDDARNGTDVMIPPVYHETNIAGVGIMYRVIDVEGIFLDLQNHTFGKETCTVKFTIEDTFFPSNNQETVVHFANGKPTVHRDHDEFDVELKMDISYFSSLLMGSMTFDKLVTYGLADISDQRYTSTINQLFLTNKKPICMSLF
ncbi:putative acetyltransferase [Salirhabdus euzebyi]|uniref:Putative acetyltransferase n=1 Tax=Salirhabdus euzebyi TaxID=394506 RepID=A0A841Q4L6_9BACI|nr:GNAT family N-acetyltransferase [Salirhabdus euzebyi]MBB6453335.1 putative acetyltransferase [Salirhabdus euzebyi]